jgi:hypothetical protein
MIPTPLGVLTTDLAASRQPPRGPLTVVPDYTVELTLPVIALAWVSAPQLLRGPGTEVTGSSGTSSAKVVSGAIPTKRSSKG